MNIAIMNTVATQYTLLEKRLHALAVRERGIILITLLLFILVLADTLFITPMQKQLQQSQQQSLQLSQKNDALALQIELLTQKIHRNPNIKLQQKRDTLFTQVKALQRSISTTTEQLIDPSQMPKLLTHLFKRQSGLHLMQVQSQPAQEIMLGQEENLQASGLYQHTLKLQFSGSFLNMHQYLSAVEADARQLYWNALVYTVEDYPKATLNLQVFTLSTSKELIGVY
ncbi:MAG: hypothetical protein HRU20_08465 [Pseudomonadales bacterium]|nr:hypothetical protein [Pseudomonadales bacterium]